jgi:hypothetical protein
LTHSAYFFNATLGNITEDLFRSQPLVPRVICLTPQLDYQHYSDQ